MSGIKLNSNIASLLTQRRLGQVSFALQQSFNRLSSGLRINSASDDAAGLAIASSLKADTAIYTQAMRNLNDGISALNIYEGALRELSTIATRQQELAAQSASGTIGEAQRQALDEEFTALYNEFNRIKGSTEFNGYNLFSDVSELDVQAGSGTDEGLTISLNGDLVTDTDAEEGIISQFGAEQASPGTLPAGAVAVRITGDRDGLYRPTDVLYSYDENMVFEDFDFQSLSNTGRWTVVDMNMDGLPDFVGVEWEGDEKFTVHQVLQTESFTMIDGPSESYDSGDPGAEDGNSFSVGDFNGDGYLDAMFTVDSGGEDVILLGEAGGNFSGSEITPNGELSQPTVANGDFDGDGFADLMYGSAVYTGDGSGNFTRAVDGYSNGEYADLNGDGLLDIAYLDGGELKVRYGNGSGADAATAIGSSGNSSIVDLVDANNDGRTDIVTATATGTRVFTRTKEGTFENSQELSGTGHAVIGDFNGDGLPDFWQGDIVRLGVGEEGIIEEYIDIGTQSKAQQAIDQLQGVQQRISSELGAVGAVQSRMQTALSNVTSTRDNYREAASRIMDVDVAQEAARLVRSNVLQQANAAVLAQANLQSELALILLESD